MKKRLLHIILLLCGFAVNAQTFPVEGMQGNGTISNPWQISSAEQLAALATFVNASAANADATEGKHYRIMNDIDLTDFLRSSSKGWQPIGKGLDIFGNNRYAFQGYIHGGGHVISGLWTRRYNSENNDPEYFFTGLFGVIENATIDSLGVEVAEGDTVVGINYVGILVGSAYWNNTITECYVKGRVKGQVHVGGMVGFLSGSRIENCYSVAPVSGISKHTGGLVGKLYYGGSVKYSYAVGDVDGYMKVGGLIGGVRHGSPVVQNNFVSQTYLRSSPEGQIGKIIGRNFESSPDASNCYANSDISVSGKGDGCYDGVDKTMANFKTKSFFTTSSYWKDSAWNFKNVWVMPHNGYPVFKWQGIPEGPEDPKDPARILELVFTNGATMDKAFHSDSLSYYVEMPCGENSTLRVALNDEDTIWFDGEFYDIGSTDFDIDYRNGTVNTLLVRVANAYGATEYRFEILTPYDSMRIIQPYHNLLEVINNPELLGGQEFQGNGTYQWYCDGNLMSGFVNGVLHADLRAGSRYSVDVTHVDGSKNKICPVTAKGQVIRLQASPNPTEGELKVTNYKFTRGKTSSTLIEVFSLTGLRVGTYQATDIHTDINLSHLPNGTYIIRCGNESVTIIKR